MFDLYVNIQGEAGNGSETAKKDMRTIVFISSKNSSPTLIVTFDHAL